MQKLEADFKESGGIFKEWKIGDLFDASNGDVDIQQKHINGIGEYVVSSGEQNTGIIGKSDIPARVFSSDTITVDMFGSVKYRSYKYKMVTHARVFSLKPKYTKFNKYIGLFIVAIMKPFCKKFSYSDMASWQKIKDNHLSLPTTATGKIDFTYMEKYISLLEKERLDSLKHWLKQNNLAATTLTTEETAALKKFRSGKVKFNIFKICGETGIFDVNNTHNILQSWIKPDSGGYPYVTAGESNNSISTYISYDMNCIEKGNSIMIGGKTLVITYQENDYFSNDSHNIALYSKEKMSKNKNCQIFLVSALYKSLKPIYSWGDSISGKKIQKDTISLPVTAVGKIDYDFMEHFISAQQKIALSGIAKIT